MKSEAPSRSAPWLEGIKVWAPLLLLVIAGFAWAWSTLDPPPPNHVRLAAGQPGGAYASFAEQYRKVAREIDPEFEIEVVATQGSVENLELLSSGEVDLALFQGGVATDQHRSELEALATLFVEPVWVFVRADLEVMRLADLVDRSIAVGTPGSGVRPLALSLLEVNEIDAETANLVEIPSMEAVAQLQSGALDAAFFAASVNASYLDGLIRDPALRLISIDRFRAYARRFDFLSHVVLGEGVVDLGENIPAQNIELLAAAAGLGARLDLHDDLIPLLLETTRRVHGDGDLFTEPGVFPGARWSDLPLEPDAELYLEKGPSFLYRFLSFRAASKIDRLKILLLPFITLLIPLFKVAPPLYRWRIRSKIYRWYEDLRHVDDILRDPEKLRDQEMLAEHLASLHRLEQEVTEVSVPLSYMDEFYRLRVHIQLILAKLETHLGNLQESGSPEMTAGTSTPQDAPADG